MVHRKCKADADRITSRLSRSQFRPYNLDFTDEQARELLQAALGNSQINWISHDSDVSGFFGALLEKFGHLLEDADHRVIKKGYVDPPPW